MTGANGATGVLLAGGLSPSMLRQQVGCPIGTLPVNEHQTLLGSWLERLGAEPRITSIIVATSDEVDRTRLAAAAEHAAVRCSVEFVVDPEPHRGTAGVVADVVRRSSSTIIVVGEVSAVPPPSLSKAIDAVETGDALMSVGVSDEMQSIGLFALHRMVLDHVPRIGYFDLKEQLVPAVVGAGHTVRAVRLMPAHLRVAALDPWLQTIRMYDGGVHPDAVVSDRSRLEGTVCIRAGASVGAAAIGDSLVMQDAVIEDGAVIARSVVGPGARVRSGHRVIDGILLSSAGAIESMAS